MKLTALVLNFIAFCIEIYQTLLMTNNYYFVIYKDGTYEKLETILKTLDTLIVVFILLAFIILVIDLVYNAIKKIKALKKE